MRPRSLLAAPLLLLAAPLLAAAAAAIRPSPATIVLIVFIAASPETVECPMNERTAPRRQV